MIRVKADPKNKQVLFGIDKATRKHKKAIRNAAYDIGAISKNDAQRRINNKNNRGRTYKIGNRVHTASAAGDAPANITGRLKRSVDFDVRSWKQMEIGYKINYGKFLEGGTRFMDRRPNLRPVADDHVQQFINLMVRHFSG